jgi:hypothetical protein
MSSKQINDSAVQGEKGTGFQKGNGAPFRCSNCEYFRKPDACVGENMKKLSDQPRHPDGSVVVSPDDFCVYIERKKSYFDKEPPYAR